MTNTQLALLIMQAWLIVAVLRTSTKASNAAFIHATGWFCVFIWLVM